MKPDWRHTSRYERFFTRWASYVWPAFFLVSVGSGIYVVWRTVKSLTPTDDLTGAVAALWSLVALGLACGTVAFTLIEFFKRLSPLRPWFNRRAVERHWWYYSHKARVTWSISFDAPLEEVAAQISSAIRLENDYEQAKESDRLRFVAQERELDAFQVRTAAAWTRLLRLLSAATASAIAGVASLATNSPPSVVVGAFLFGWTIGGPFSWAIRDLVRVVEARAR